MMISKKRDSHFSTLTFLSWFLILLLLHCSGICFFLYVSIMQVERDMWNFLPTKTNVTRQRSWFFFLCVITNNTCWLANCIMQRDTRAVVLSTFFALNMLGTSWQIGQIGQILIGFQFIYSLEDFFFVFFFSLIILIL